MSQETKEPMATEDYLVKVVDRKEPDGTFTKAIYIAQLADDGSPPNEPHQVGMVQQQELNGWTYKTVEAIAELFYKQNQTAIDRDAPEPQEAPPEEPTIILPSDAELKKAKGIK